MFRCFSCKDPKGSLFSVGYFSRGALPKKRNRKRVLLEDLVKETENGTPQGLSRARLAPKPKSWSFEQMAAWSVTFATTEEVGGTGLPEVRLGNWDYFTSFRLTQISGPSFAVAQQP